MNSEPTNRSRCSGEDVTVFYGDKQALFDVDLDVRENTGDRPDRPVGLRQVDLPALPQPHERHDRRRPRRRHDHARRRGHLRPEHRRGASCAPASAWCSRSPTRSRSRSTRTSPMARASTASPTSKAELDEIVETSLKTRRPVGRGQGPPARAGHRPVRRPAAAPVHRPRHRRRARSHPDGRALLGARPDRHRQDRGTDRRAARATTRIVIVTHSMQQAARVSQRTAFFHLGDLVEDGDDRRDLHQPATTSARRTTSPAASAEPQRHTRT